MAQFQTDWLTCQTVSQVASGGDQVWNSSSGSLVTDLATDGDLYTAYAGITNNMPAGATRYTYLLRCMNVASKLPQGAHVLGIEARFRREGGADGDLQYEYEHVIQLLRGGAVAGNNKASTGTVIGNASHYVTYGSSADLWGLSELRADDVNAADFGVGLQFRFVNAAAGTFTCSVSLYVAFLKFHYEQRGMFLVL